MINACNTQQMGAAGVSPVTIRRLSIQIRAIDHQSMMMIIVARGNLYSFKKDLLFICVRCW